MGFASFFVDDARKRGGRGMLGDRAIGGILGRKRSVEIGFRHDYFYDISKSSSCENVQLVPRGVEKGVVPFRNPV
jgi:hypothetical protein